MDLSQRGHYEVHGEEDASAQTVTGQRFAFSRTPSATASGSTAFQGAPATPRATVSKTFQR